jgi:hypothetical protein
MGCEDFWEEKRKSLSVYENHYTFFEEYPQRVLYQRVAEISPIENFE